jgi:hypothetical protein
MGPGCQVSSRVPPPIGRKAYRRPLCTLVTFLRVSSGSPSSPPRRFRLPSTLPRKTRTSSKGVPYARLSDHLSCSQRLGEAWDRLSHGRGRGALPGAHMEPSVSRDRLLEPYGTDSRDAGFRQDLSSSGCSSRHSREFSCFTQSVDPSFNAGLGHSLVLLPNLLC